MKRVSAISLSLLATAVAVRVGLIFRYRFDSDEPQHMHVAWGWAHGLAQYRDVFDNHMPLFHLLTSPLFAATGDDPRLLFAARLSMVPLFLAALFLVWRIARSLFDETTAWWATAIAAVVPPFFLGSLEYRTDDLWLVLWLGVIAIAVSNAAPARKAALGGLLLGGAFGVSMKSTLFVVVLVVALAATLLLTMRRAPLPSPRLVAKCALLAAAATAFVPLLIAAGFAMAGLWRPFVYGVFLHNATPFVHAWRVLWFIPFYFFIRAVALRMARSDAEPALVRRRLFVFLACGVYLALYASFAPMTNLETYLPFYPLAALLATPLLMRRERLLPALAVAMIAVVVVTAQPWRNEAERSIVLVEEIAADRVDTLGLEAGFQRGVREAGHADDPAADTGGVRGTPDHAGQRRAHLAADAEHHDGARGAGQCVHQFRRGAAHRLLQRGDVLETFGQLHPVSLNPPLFTNW